MAYMAPTSGIVILLNGIPEPAITQPQSIQRNANVMMVSDDSYRLLGLIPIAAKPVLNDNPAKFYFLAYDVMNNLEVWQSLQTNWSQAYEAAKSAEQQLDEQMTRFLKNEGPSVTAMEDMNKVMELWIAAAQSLAAMDEFVNDRAAQPVLNS